MRSSVDKKKANVKYKGRNAHKNVLLEIFVLCLFGAICSFHTEWMNRIIIWFAKINSKYGTA